MKLNTILRDAPASGIIKMRGLEAKTAWEQAIDATDYPVHIVDAFYQIREGEYRNANGKTNTGRDKHFNLVLVNKLREPGDDAFQCISTVTGQYGTLLTPTIYATFRDDLLKLNQKHHIESLYVTGNGGAQKLTVSMDEMEYLAHGSSTLPDALVMHVRLDTSVDGSKAHTVSLMAHNLTGDSSISVYGGEYRLTARHTTTIQERTVDFLPQITKMIANWNDTIIPMMKLIYDEKFNRSAAITLLKQMGDDAGIGERHMEKIVALYETPAVFTKDNSDSLYRVNAALNHYIETELDERPELQDRFKVGLTRSLEKQVKRIKAKK